MVTGRGFKNQGRPIPQRYLTPGGSDDRETSDSGCHPIPRWYRREAGEASNEEAAISGSLKLERRAKLLGAPLYRGGIGGRRVKPQTRRRRSAAA